MLCDISMLVSYTSSQTLIMLPFLGPPEVLSLPHWQEWTLNDTVRKFIVLRIREYWALSSPSFFHEELGTWQSAMLHNLTWSVQGGEEAQRRPGRLFQCVFLGQMTSSEFLISFLLRQDRILFPVLVNNLTSPVPSHSHLWPFLPKQLP